MVETGNKDIKPSVAPVVVGHSKIDPELEKEYIKSRTKNAFILLKMDKLKPEDLGFESDPPVVKR